MLKKIPANKSNNLINQIYTHIDKFIGELLASFLSDPRALLAKSLPNRPLHKGCVWAHESRADLEPLRFSTHERSGVGSESGLAGELFSLIFPLENFGHNLIACCRETFCLVEWPAIRVRVP